MTIDIAIPEVGESIRSGVLVRWLASEGADVSLDQPLFELETDKITLSVTAEQAGRLHQLVEAGAEVQVGQVVARLEPARAEPPGVVEQVETRAPPSSVAPSAPLQDYPPGARFQALLQGVDPLTVLPTGRGGRPTKQDVLVAAARVASEASVETEPVPLPSPGPFLPPPPLAVAPAELPRLSPPPGTENPRQTRIPLSPLRHRLAERLVQSLQTTAQLTTFNEADCSRMMALRAQYKDAFQERHHANLGFMPFFVKAVVDALRLVPALASWIEGDAIVQNHNLDIGVAVSTPRGLVVPVLRDVDRLSFAALESAIADLSLRAREGRLTLADLNGGVFTVSNGGVFGSLFSTPILNPPQSGILGMHAIKKRAVVVEDQVVARPMMYLALSYDHRVIDGEQAVTFLKRIVQCIESPERLLLEV